MRMRSSWSSALPMRCKSTSPIPSASSSFRTFSTEGSFRKRTRTSVPPRKSTPQLRPRVNNVKRLATTATAEMPMKRNFFPITSKLVLVKRWNCFTLESPFRASDAQVVHPTRAQVGVEQGVRDEYVGIQVCNDSDAQRHGETADRPGAVAKQEQRGDEGRHVGIHDGAEGFGEAARHGSLDGLPQPKLFSDSLEDQHVGVYRHADGQGDPGNT